MPSSPELPQRIAAVRRFNRNYTRRLGLLEDGYLHTPYTLTEARVLHELAQRRDCTATEIAGTLALDHGYLSRILRAFAQRRLVAKLPSGQDRRQSLLSLTAKGRRAYAPLERRSNERVGGMLGRLSTSEQARMVAAMEAIQRMLGEAPAAPVPYVLRPPRAGDMGWIVSRHGALYREEYGWDWRLEGLCGEIVATFVRNFDVERECCWIAERSGENVGSVLLVKEADDVGRLRLLLVEPSARGLGIGNRLVEECVRFARVARYRRLTLWTHSVLVAARHIYQRAGFKLVNTWTHVDFGKKLIGENWDLELANSE